MELGLEFGTKEVIEDGLSTEGAGRVGESLHVAEFLNEGDLSTMRLPSLG